MQRCSKQFMLFKMFVLIIAAMSGCSKEPAANKAPTPSTTIPSVQPVAGSSPTAQSTAPLQTKVLTSTLQLRSARPHEIEYSPQSDIVFSPQGQGVAYIAEKDDYVWVVHNGKPGKRHSDLSHLVISHDGLHVAYSSRMGDYQQMVSDGMESKPYIDVYDMVYSPDSRHAVYLAEGADKSGMHIVLDGKPIETCPNVVTGAFLFTNDSSKLLYHIRPKTEGPDAQLIILDLISKSKKIISCLDIEIAINSSRDRIAMAIKDGDKQRVADFAVATPDKVHTSAVYDVVSDIVVGDDNSVAFIGSRKGHRYLIVNSRETQLPDALGAESRPVVQPDGQGGGIVLATKERHNRTYVFYRTDGKKEKIYGKVLEPVYCRSSGALAYVAQVNDRYSLVLNGKEGPAFDMIVTPMCSPDGRTIAYRGRNGAKRQVVVADIATNQHQPHQEYEMIFPALFAGDGTSISYGVKEGDNFVWKVDKL